VPKRYLIAGADNPPAKLVALCEHFARMMLAKGYQLRVGDDDLGAKSMTAALQEGHYYSVEPDPWMFAAETNTADVVGKAIYYYPCYTEADKFLKAKIRARVALLLGEHTPCKSAVAVLWNPNHACSHLTAVAALAETLDIKVLNLANPDNLSKVVLMVKKHNTKSSLQKLTSKFVRR
jgi:hypothetical protein